MRVHSCGDLTRIVLSGIHAGVCYQCFTVIESTDVSDFGHDLRAEARTYAIHGTNGLILRERGCEFIHLPAEFFDML